MFTLLTLIKGDYMEADVQKRLILAGIRELEEHGPADFSLRRVAQLSGVSCAAPYRHFKSREDLIIEIMNYVNSKWDLLFHQICEIYDNDIKSAICEAAASAVKFFAANSNYRAVIFSSLFDPDEKRSNARKHISSEIDSLVTKYCSFAKLENAKERSFAIRSALYGTITMICGGETENAHREIEFLKNQIKKELE